MKKLFPGTAEDWETLLKHYEYAKGGLDPDVVDAFPAEELVEATDILRDRWFRFGGKIVMGDFAR